MVQSFNTIRTSLGHRVHIIPTSKRRAYIKLEHIQESYAQGQALHTSHSPPCKVGFNFKPPYEFDAIFAHVFLREFPHELFIEENQNQNEEAIADEDGIVARSIDLEEEGESEPEIIEIPKHQIIKLDWIDDLEIGVILDGVEIFRNRLSLWEPYWINAARPFQDMNLKILFEKIKSISDLCRLAKMGYAWNLTDVHRRARHVEESIYFSFYWKEAPPEEIELEIAIPGILYVPMRGDANDDDGDDNSTIGDASNSGIMEEATSGSVSGNTVNIEYTLENSFGEDPET